MNRSTYHKFVAVGVALLLGSAVGVLAQEETGNVYAQVSDTSGNRLPGVTCELSGLGAPQTRVTNTAGEARWLALDPGNWALKCSLEGFSTVEYPSINVRVARNVTIQVQLSEAIGEVITVTSESPLLDERRIQAGTTVTQVELEKIPTARDPWSILNQTQGVIVDRINVGGNESGQQAVFLGPGVSDDENDFLVDGVQITDMSAVGASPTYYDFDQFTEMQFSVGGSDVTKNTAGVSVNLVTKRGTNEFRGSGRFFVTDGGGVLEIFDQADPSISAGDLGPGQTFFAGNQINRVDDFGFEAGGPILRDRLWVWGSWGQNDIKNLIPGSTTDPAAAFLKDDTTLENTSVKFNAQLSGSNSGVFSWNNGDKVKLGRNASPTRPTETTWDQRGPSALWKVEDTHVFSSNFFLSGTWSKMDGGFQLTAKGGPGPDAPRAWRDASRVWHDNYLSGASSRPSEEYKLDGSYFFNTGTATNHELKFGARMREFEGIDIFTWPGGNVFSLALGGGTFPLVVFRRGGSPPAETTYQSAWVQDTITTGNWTINAGLRFDLQEGKNLASTVQGPSGIDVIYQGDLVDIGTLMPTINVQEEDTPFDWTSIAPRLGVTYALGEERKTLLRASYSQFAEQLEQSDVTRLNPGYYAYGYFYNLTDAANPGPNVRYDDGDLLYWLFPGYFDPNNPTISPSRTDGALDPPMTNELIVGAEHAFLPEFVVGATITWRNTTDVLETRDFIRPAGSTEVPGRIATVADYVSDGTVSGTLPNGSAYNVPVFALNPNWEFTGGNLLLNGDREIDFLGYAVNFTKRLSNQWMMRGYFQYGEAEWDIPGSFLQFDDPNPDGGTTFGEDVDGGLVAIAAAGSGAKSDVILQTTWSWNLNGMYQVAPDRPWGFNIAANIFGREGYALPYFHQATQSDGNTREIRVTNDIAAFRADDILVTDVRLEKEFSTSGNLGLTFSIDAFNVFNENYILQRERDLNTGSADWLRETLSPRIYRLGVRLNWR